MPRASFAAAAAGALLLALADPSQPAAAAAAVSEKAAIDAAAELVGANPGGASSLVAVVNYESVAGRMLGERLAAFARANPDIRILVRPVSGSAPLSEFLAKAAYAAARQGRFQAFHEAALAAPIAHTWYSLRDTAPLLGLDWQRFQQDFMDPQLAEEVRANTKFAEAHKLAAPLALIAGGEVFAGPWEKPDLRSIAAAARSEAGVVPTGVK